MISFNHLFKLYNIYLLKMLPCSKCQHNFRGCAQILLQVLACVKESGSGSKRYRKCASPFFPTMKSWQSNYKWDQLHGHRLTCESLYKVQYHCQQLHSVMKSLCQEYKEELAKQGYTALRNLNSSFRSGSIQFLP